MGFVGSSTGSRPFHLRLFTQRIPLVTDAKYEILTRAQDINSVKVLNKVLDYEASLDLVVLNGDLITGENTYKENATTYIDQIVGPMVSRSLPWASTYGNHDSDYNISRGAILEREQQWPNARTKQMVFGPNTGVTNYYLPVYGSDCKSADGTGCTPSLLLWFFDSRGGFLYQQKDPSGNRVGQPDWVDESVVAWYTTTSAALQQQYGRIIPSLAFVHIPVNASLALQGKGVDSHRQPGINDDVPLAQQAGGWCADGSNAPGCNYGGQDVPFMRAITSTPGLMALFSGHDHGDTWCYKWDSQLPGMAFSGNGLNLCFGQHSGYGGYGNWIRGARQVKITEEQLKSLAVNTYIRLESGASVGAVTLNSTYGSDVYPQTPNDKTYCPTCDYSSVTPMPGTNNRGDSQQYRLADRR
jgi:hypothetical protein